MMDRVGEAVVAVLPEQLRLLFGEIILFGFFFFKDSSWSSIICSFDVISPLLSDLTFLKFSSFDLSSRVSLTELSASLGKGVKVLFEVVNSNGDEDDIDDSNDDCCDNDVEGSDESSLSFLDLEGGNCKDEVVVVNCVVVVGDDETSDITFDM